MCLRLEEHLIFRMHYPSWITLNYNSVKFSLPVVQVQLPVCGGQFRFSERQWIVDFWLLCGVFMVCWCLSRDEQERGTRVWTRLNRSRRCCGSAVRLKPPESWSAPGRAVYWGSPRRWRCNELANAALSDALLSRRPAGSCGEAQAVLTAVQLIIPRSAPQQHRDSGR